MSQLVNSSEWTSEIFVNDSDRRFFNEKSSELSRNLFKEILSEKSKKNQNSLFLAALVCIFLSLGVNVTGVPGWISFDTKNTFLIRYVALSLTVYFLIVFYVSIIQDWQVFSYQNPSDREDFAALMTLMINKADSIAKKNVDLSKSIRENYEREISEHNKLTENYDNLKKKMMQNETINLDEWDPDLQKAISDRLNSRHADEALKNSDISELKWEIYNDIDDILQDKRNKIMSEFNLAMKKFETSQDYFRIQVNRHLILKKTFINHQKISMVRYCLDIAFPISLRIFAIGLLIYTVIFTRLSPT
jgi:hypothetical protein